MRSMLLVLALLGVSAPVGAQGYLVPRSCAFQALNLFSLDHVDAWLAADYVPNHELSTDPTHGGFELYSGPGRDYTGRWSFDYDAESRLTEIALLLAEDDGFEPYERTQYTYDGAGRVATEITYDGDGAGGWTPQRRESMTYDADGNEVGFLRDLWDEETGAWSPRVRETKVYVDGQLTEVAGESWSTDVGGYTLSDRYLYGYDEQGRQNEVIRQVGGASGYENNERRFISSFVGIHPIERIIQTPDGAGWRTTQREVQSSGSEEAVVLRRERSSGSGTWRLAGERHLRFEGERLTEAFYRLRLNSGRLSNQERVAIGYDAAGRINDVRETNDLDDDGTWEPVGSDNDRQICTYDAAGRIIAREWGLVSQATEREAYTYDAEGILQSTVTEEWDGTQWVERFALLRFDRSTATPEAPEGAAVMLAVAPNPLGARGHVTLTLGAPARVRAVVVDMLGREVALLHDGPLTGGAHRLALDASRLAPGVYRVHVQADDAALSRPLTVVR